MRPLTPTLAWPLLPLLLAAALTGPATAATPDLDSEVEIFLEPSPVAATAVVASEDTRLLQDVFENTQDKPMTEEPPLEEEVAVTTEETVSEVLEAGPRIAYSQAWVNKTYMAKDNFNPRGMEHLYLITNLFLDLVHRDREVPVELGKYTFFTVLSGSYVVLTLVHLTVAVLESPPT